MEFKDYYGILGVTSDADDKTIKSAYRKLARQYHPDVSSDQDAERKFKEVSEAYQALKDPEKRAEYDRLRQYQSGGGFTPPPGWRGFQGGGQSGFEDEEAFSDFFQSIFGAGFGSHPGPRPGRDVEVELPLFLEDTVADTGKRIRVGERTLNVTIPAGTGDNERIRLKGQGAPGIDGGPTGDLYLRVRLAPHPLFDLDGRDLIITLPITPWEAALGAKIPLPTLTGRIQVTIPANSQNGRRLRLKGQGLRGEPPGDLYAVLKVVMPERADERTQALWRELAEHSDFNPRAGWADQE